jgi:hypothetical protein
LTVLKKEVNGRYFSFKKADQHGFHTLIDILAFLSLSEFSIAVTGVVSL